MEEEKEDNYAFIAKFCQPTASQEAKLSNCLLERESENFSDTNQGTFSQSSPYPTPSQPPVIVMFSPPDTKGNDWNSQLEDDAVFHTPPEEQNLDESTSEGVRTVELGDVCDKSRNFDGEIEDRSNSKRPRVSEAELDGETVFGGETEMIELEINGNENVNNMTEVIDLVSSGEEIAAVNLDDSMDKIVEEVAEWCEKNYREWNVGETQGVGEKSVHELNDPLIENVDQMIGTKATEYLTVTKGDKSYKNIDSSENLGNDKVAGDKRVETIEKSVVGQESLNVNEKESRLRFENVEPQSCSKSINEIDKFRYVGDGEIGRKGKTIVRGGDVGKKRELPLSLKGKGKSLVGGDVAADTVKAKKGLFLREFLDVFSVGDKDADGECENVDIIQIAKERGMTFPRPRWWPSEWGNE